MQSTVRSTCRLVPFNFVAGCPGKQRTCRAMMPIETVSVNLASGRQNTRDMHKLHIRQEPGKSMLEWSASEHCLFAGGAGGGQAGPEPLESSAAFRRQG